MTRRVPRNKRPRWLDRRLVTLALARGGMLLDCTSAWAVYRCQDARRIQIGIITRELAAELEDDGVAQPDAVLPGRLCAGPAARV